MSFVSTRNVKSTRKPHRCKWCSTKIEQGSSTVYEAWVWEGDFGHGHIHPECVHAREYLFKISKWARQEGVEYGGFARGSIAEHGEPQFTPDGTMITKPNEDDII